MAKHKVVDLLYELMRDSKRSDRELAKAIGVSQPTVTRMRKNLEKQELIREYTVIPSLEKLGFQILAFNLVKADLTKDLGEWISRNQKILFACQSQGAGSGLLIASVHKDYSDYSGFIHELKRHIGQNTTVKSFLSSLSVDVVKDLSFKNLERLG